MSLSDDPKSANGLLRPPHPLKNAAFYAGAARMNLISLMVAATGLVVVGEALPAVAFAVAAVGWGYLDVSFSRAAARKPHSTHRHMRWAGAMTSVSIVLLCEMLIYAWRGDAPYAVLFGSAYLVAGCRAIAHAKITHHLPLN